MATPLYRKSVGICLLNKTGHVFLAQRIDTQGAWQMPQGGVDENEDLTRAVFREMKEEIGTDKARILAQAPEKLRYDFPEWMRLNRKMFQGKYAGQEQTWFALLFEGEDSDIDLSAAQTGEPAEFNAWKWEELSKAPALIVDFKKPVYEKLVTFFEPFAEALAKGEALPSL